ncbi:MAG: hypothetical protein ACON4F_00445 [Candidatus Puniceispirillaceae bacterium]
MTKHPTRRGTTAQHPPQPPTTKKVTKRATHKPETQKKRNKRKTAFLEALSLCGNVTVAAEATQIDRSLCQKWCRHDQRFKAAFDNAMATAFDRLLQSAWDRAIDGEEVPYFYRGEQVGSYQRRSDQLIIFLLRFVRQLQETQPDLEFNDSLKQQKDQLLRLLARFDDNRPAPSDTGPDEI